MNPLVSVIIPVYKVEKYVAACIQSVVDQTYPQECIEIVVVVDGEQPDLSEEVVRSLAAKHSNIKIIKQENRGLTGARNTGIRESNGQYIFFLDSDDIFASNKIEKHVNHLESNPYIGVSFSRAQFMDEAGNCINYFTMPVLKNIDFPTVLMRNPPGCGSTPVLRRQTLKDIEFVHPNKLYPCYFDEDFKRAEDVECWCRIILITPWITEGIPEALTFYRINDSGLSADISKQESALNQLLTKLNKLYPEETREYSSLARAYQYRYLARRAIRSKEGKIAFDYINKAFLTNIKSVFQEPKRSLLTLVAAYMLHFLPKPLYRVVENISIKITGALQKKSNL